MYACPLCNGFISKKEKCPSCHHEMHNQGRVIDYMDDYIAYLDYDGTKLIDGVLDSTDQHTCLHLFRCSECEKDIHVQIQEILL